MRARIERDRDDSAASQAALTWAVELLSAASASTDRARVLARALTELGDSHRRAGRYPQAIDALRRARHLAEAADPMQLAATLHHNLAGLAYARQRYPQAESHARRAVPLLVVLAAVATLAAPAYADPPPTGGSGDSGTGTGKVVAAVQNLSDKDPWPDPPAVDGIEIIHPGGGDDGPKAAIAVIKPRSSNIASASPSLSGIRRGTLPCSVGSVSSEA